MTSSPTPPPHNPCQSGLAVQANLVHTFPKSRPRPYARPMGGIGLPAINEHHHNEEDRVVRVNPPEKTPHILPIVLPPITPFGSSDSSLSGAVEAIINIIAG